MKTIPQVLVVGVAAAAALAGGGAAQTGAQAQPSIVVLRATADVTQAVRDHARLGVDVGLVYRHALAGYAARLTPKQLAAVRDDPRVRFVAVDRVLRATEQAVPTGVRRIGASGAPAGVSPARGLGPVGVAVLDSGIDLDHPDLGPVVPARNCVGRDPRPDDEYGHGTHVAGTIAARDNGLGVVGVAPDVRLYAVKVLNGEGYGSWSTLICGIDWVSANAAHVHVANVSLAGRGDAMPSNAACLNANADALHMAICRSVKLGVTYVAAAGNGRQDAARVVPAAYEEVIAVSAIADSDGAPGGAGPSPACRTSERDDAFASFSNWGAVVDLAAPGVCVLSTEAGGGYRLMTGTSAAAPHVAGAAARYVAANPGASPAQVAAALVAGAEPGPIPGDPDADHEGVVRVPSGAGEWTAPLVPALPTVELPGLPALPKLPLLPALPLE